MNVYLQKQGADICHNDFCFKAHRNETETPGNVYTVNKIGFNKVHNTFCTVGSDGTYVIWNKDTKSRYRLSKESPMPLMHVCFSDDASTLAFCHGEDWTKGKWFAENKRQNNVKIFVRKTEKEDVFKNKK